MLAPPFGDKVGFLSDMIRLYHSTNQNFFRIFWNFLIGRMMWHCMAQQGLFKPCLRLGFRDSAQYPEKMRFPSTSLYLLYSSLSPLHVQRVGHPSGKDPRRGDAWNKKATGHL